MSKKSELFNRIKSPSMAPADPAEHRKAQMSKLKGFKGAATANPASYFKKSPVRQTQGRG